MNLGPDVLLSYFCSQIYQRISESGKYLGPDGFRIWSNDTKYAKMIIYWLWMKLGVTAWLSVLAAVLPTASSQPAQTPAVGFWAIGEREYRKEKKEDDPIQIGSLDWTTTGLTGLDYYTMPRNITSWAGSERQMYTELYYMGSEPDSSWLPNLGTNKCMTM